MNGAELLIPLAALAASLLTFFSGFGLGTLLMPVFALFFPLEVAVAMTAVVHLLNNAFKFALLWRQASKRMLFLFGVPGILGAWLGAQQLMHWEEHGALYEGVLHPVSVTRLVIGILMVVFALLELIPAGGKWSLPPRFVVAGGLLSGFFGGLSGHQGALRSIFLLRTGLGKEAFIATSVGIAVLVDITRIPVYAADGSRIPWAEEGWLMLASVAAAFAGAWWGRRLLPKITVEAVRITVAILLLLIAAALIAGVI